MKPTNSKQTTQVKTPMNTSMNTTQGGQKNQINKKNKAIKLALIALSTSLTIPFGSYSIGAPSPSPSTASKSQAQQQTQSNTSAQGNPGNTPGNTSSGMMGPVSYSDAVAKAAPAVVSIKTTKEIPMDMNPLFQDPFFRYFFGAPNLQAENDVNNLNEPPKEIQKGLGSGVIVGDKGYVLTNNHVIQDSDTIVITLPDGRTADAKIIGTDPDTDLAVLQIKLEKLPIISLGSSHKLRAGDVVLAIGNPFGLDKTVTQGIISATERTGAEIGILENLLQTDAAINPGNSGGALIDAQGHLIGINTAIISRTGGYQGIGFAIPIDQAMDIMNKLITVGHVSRGYLGVNLQNLNKEIRDQIEFKENEGVYIQAVVRNSPAQKAGLLPGDIITKINNMPAKDNRAAMQVVSGLAANKSYPIEIFRKGEHMTFSVMVGERKQPPKPSKPKLAQKENESGKEREIE